MKKRPSYDIREKILWLVKEKELNYADINRKIGTNYYSLKKHISDLEDSGEVSLRKEEKDKTRGQLSYFVTITEHGHKTLDNKKKRKSI
ncbi:hypothetical protein J4437_01730 [Candidatus Woesearchaeota archaeon]|nr:hypothetical protein [Candidatus Woesearchaeota archaeon]